MNGLLIYLKSSILLNESTTYNFASTSAIGASFKKVVKKIKN